MVNREKLNFHIKKKQTLIEAHVEAKTTDGYTLRLVRTTHQQQGHDFTFWCQQQRCADVLVLLWVFSSPSPSRRRRRAR